MSWLVARDGGAELTLHIQPRAARTEVAGTHGDALKIRLAAPPVDGAANEELIRFLAGQLGVARNAVTIVSGATGRRKRVRVAGVEAGSAMQKLGVEG
ncbi:MAG TPA: DUF167 family protein [Gemmatimonadales bacterium]|nr:DUF167 family protein [Gemmatimonadales bacterium]